MNQVDEDGKNEYSDVISVSNKFDETSIQIAPNPSKGVFTLSVLNGIDNIIITNSLGEVVYQNNLTKQNTEVDLSHLPNGIYHVSLEDGFYTVSEKLVLNR